MEDGSLGGNVTLSSGPRVAAGDRTGQTPSSRDTDNGDDQVAVKNMLMVSSDTSSSCSSCSRGPSSPSARSTVDSEQLTSRSPMTFMASAAPRASAVAQKYYDRGLCAMQSGASSVALLFFSKAAFLAPHVLYPVLSKAEAYAQLSDLQSAIACYRRALWMLSRPQQLSGQPLTSQARMGWMRKAWFDALRRSCKMMQSSKSFLDLSGSLLCSRGGGEELSDLTDPPTATVSPLRVGKMQLKHKRLMEQLQNDVGREWCGQTEHSIRIRLVELLHAQGLVAYHANRLQQGLFFVTEAMDYITWLREALWRERQAEIERGKGNIAKSRGRRPSREENESSASAIGNSVTLGEKQSDQDVAELKQLYETVVRESYEGVEEKLGALERQCTIHKCVFLLSVGKEEDAEIDLRRFLTFFQPLLSASAARTGTSHNGARKGSGSASGSCTHNPLVDTPDAVDQASAAWRLPRDTMELHGVLLLADIYRRRGLFLDSRKLLDPVSASVWCTHPDLLDAEQAFSISFTEYRTEALMGLNIKALTRCLETFPDDPDLYLGRAKAHLIPAATSSAAAAGENATAIDRDSSVKRAIRDLFVCIQKTAGTCSEAVELMTSLLFALGAGADTRENAHSAASYYSESLKWRPDNPSVLLARGDCYFRLNQLDDAIKDYSRVLEVRNGHPEAAERLAAVHDLLGTRLMEEAAKATPYQPLKESLEAPVAVAASANHAVSRAATGNGRESLEVSRGGCQPHPKASTRFHATHEDYLLRRRQLLVQAEAQFSKAIQLHDQEPRFFVHRAECRFQLGLVPYALRDILSCQELQPSDPLIRAYVDQFASTLAPAPPAHVLAEQRQMHLLRSRNDSKESHRSPQPPTPPLLPPALPVNASGSTVGLNTKLTLVASQMTLQLPSLVASQWSTQKRGRRQKPVRTKL